MDGEQSAAAPTSRESAVTIVGGRASEMDADEDREWDENRFGTREGQEVCGDVAREDAQDDWNLGHRIMHSGSTEGTVG